MRTTNSWNYLFDLDGTLTDPKLGITKAVAFALGRLGLPVPELDSLTKFIGPPLQVSFREFYGMDEETIQNAIAHYREYFSQTGIFENEKYEGIDQLLQKLKSAGKRLFVATSKPEVFAKRIIEHFNLGSYFDGVYGSELDGRRSDKAELIRHLIRSEGLDPSETIMVGDRRHDVIGAKVNGLISIGVGYGYGTKEELTAAGCDHYADTVRNVESLLQF